MEKISINLLPKEFTEEQIKRTKFYKIQKLSIFIILLLIFFSILTVSLRILQSGQHSTNKAVAEEAEQRVAVFANKQASLVILSDRLKVIKQYFGVSSKQVEMYNLINALLPQGLLINQISLGGGEVLISAITSDVQTIDRILNDLLDEGKNEKISKIAIESFNRGRDGIYRINFKIATK